MATQNKNKNTSDWVPVKAIQNGVIINNRNEKISGIKIQPRNIFILDSDVMISIITNLRNVYNVIDYEFWIIAADRPVDLNVYLSNLQVLYNKIQNPIKRKIIMEDIEKANEFMNNNVVDTEYYLLFKDKDIDKIQKNIRELIQSFSSAGLNCAQVSNEDLRIILDNFLNGGQTTNFGTVMP